MSTPTPQPVQDAIDEASRIADEMSGQATWKYPSPVDRVRDALKPATDYIRDRLNRTVPMHPHEPAADIVRRVRKGVLEASGVKPDEAQGSHNRSKM